jgi:alkylation response protein AidB-like acyl-CoA dehydrogenase
MEIRIDEAIVARTRELGPLVREHAAEGERERRLARPVLEALEHAGLTRLFLPRSLGGLETDPVTHARVVEEIAGHDSAAGWLLMVANAGAWFAGRLPAETAEELFADPRHALIATTFQPPVEAREDAGGYRLTGRRPFASFARSARWVCVTAIVLEGDQPRMVHGMPQVIVAILPADRAEVIDTWFGLGLRGSDSCDVALDDVHVPQAFTCPLAPTFEPNRHYRGPLYRMPVLGPITLATIPPVAIAVARRAIEEVRALSSKRVPMGSMVPLRDRGTAQARLGRAEALLRAARAFLYATLADAWARTLAGETLTVREKADLLLAATHAAQTSAEVADLMFTSGGSSAVYAGHALERAFRDAQVIRQHGFVASSRYETVAQVMLGLEADLPFVHF